MLHKLFIPIFRYNNKRVAILGNIRRKIKKQYHFMQESTDKFKNEELILRDYLAIAWVCVATGVILFILGFIRYFQMGKQLKGYVKQSHCD